MSKVDDSIDVWSSIKKEDPEKDKDPEKKETTDPDPQKGPENPESSLKNDPPPADPPVDPEKDPPKDPEEKKPEGDKEGMTFEFSIGDDKQKGQDDVAKFVFEKTGGKYKSLDEVIMAAEQPSTNFASPEIEMINNMALQNGGKVDFNTFQLLSNLNTDGDFSTRESKINLVKTKLKLENPTLSDPQIDLLIKDSFIVAEDSSDDDKLRVNTKLEMEFNESKVFIENYKQKSLSAPRWEEAQKQREEQVKAQAELKRVIEGEIDEAVAGMTVIQVLGRKGNETETLFKYDVPEEKRNSAAKMAKSAFYPDPQSEFWARYMDEKGNFNSKALYEDMVFLEAKHDIMAALGNIKRSEGVDKVLSEVKNQTIGSPEKSKNPKNPEGLPKLQDII